MLRFIAGAIGLLLAAAPCFAGPEPPNPAPPADDLVLEALARAPGIAALEARVDAARQMIRPAGALPNPMLDLMLQDVGFPDWTIGEMEMSMVGPRITQGIPFPGKRGARRAVARAEVGVRDGELDALRRDVAREIRVNYAALYRLDQESKSLDSGAELLEMLAATTNTNYATGQSGQEAVLKVQIARSRLRERRIDLVSERAALVAAMNRLLDRPGAAPLGEVMSLPAPAPPPDSLEAEVAARSAEVQIRQAALRTAEARANAARIERRPDLSATAGIGFRGRRDPVVTLGVGIELPLWNGQGKTPLARAAATELEAARHELRTAEAAARADAARLLAAWRRAGDQVDLYEQALVPQTSLAFDAARSAYMTGRGDFSTVIEDFNLWIDTRATLARRKSEQYAAWAEMTALLESPGADRPAGK